MKTYGLRCISQGQHGKKSLPPLCSVEVGCIASFEVWRAARELLPQEGNPSAAACSGTPYTAAEIRESGSPRNYHRRTLDAGDRPLILFRSRDTLTCQNSHRPRCHGAGENGARRAKPHRLGEIDAIINVIRFTKSAVCHGTLL